MYKSILADVPKEKLPKHVGIILDGNGRWAKNRGLPRREGHRRGSEVFSKIAGHCRAVGIPYLTAYVFSTENWKRPPEEINAIMDLLRQALDEAFRRQSEGVQVRILGDRTPLAPDLIQRIELLEQESTRKVDFHLNFALNYGGRDEIVQAARSLAAACANGTLDWQKIDEETLAAQLYTAGQPDPDLIIRPSGEQRISNFLLWQSAYAELIFMDRLWPDFTPADFDRAVMDYLNRSRRFGGV